MELNKDNLLLLILFGLPCLLVIYKVFLTGPILTNDSYEYIGWSKALIENSSNISSKYESYELVQPQIFYIFNTLIFSWFISFSPENWITYFLLFNCLSVSVIFLNLYIFSKKFLTSKYVLFSVPIIFLCGDIFIWPSYILLDTFYASIVISLMNLFIFLYNKKIFVFLIFIFLVFLKPQSLAVGLGIFFIYFILMPKIFIFYTKFTAASLFLIVLIFASFFTLIFSDLVVNNIGSQSINLLKEFIDRGMIVKDRVDGYYLGNIDDISASIIFIRRFFSFFQPWVLDFSLMHNIMYMILNTSFCLAIFGYLFHNYFKINESIFKILSIIFLLILAGAIFHSFTFIDFDWRYRFPYVGPMTLFFGLILDQYLNYKKINKGLRSTSY